MAQDFKYIIKHKHNMGFKTITIKESVYNELLRAKGKEESFSNFLGELVETKKKKVDIMRFAGAWNGMSNKEFEKVKNSMKELRESADTNFKERMKRLYK